jgi:hypothetical protein
MSSKFVTAGARGVAWRWDAFQAFPRNKIPISNGKATAIRECPIPG